MIARLKQEQKLLHLQYESLERETPFRIYPFRATANSLPSKHFVIGRCEGDDFLIEVKDLRFPNIGADYSLGRIDPNAYGELDLCHECGELATLELHQCPPKWWAYCRTVEAREDGKWVYARTPREAALEYWRCEAAHASPDRAGIVVTAEDQMNAGVSAQSIAYVLYPKHSRKREGADAFVLYAEDVAEFAIHPDSDPGV